MRHPLSFEELYPELCKPFPPEVIELKPIATTKDKTKACAFAYASVWLYRKRLNQLIGPENWCQEFRFLDANTVICRLSLFGAVREEVGEEEEELEQNPSKRKGNASTGRAAQAFKRSCAAFGLGSYLYDLRAPWLAYDALKKRFADTIAPAKIVKQLYQEANLPTPFTFTNIHSRSSTTVSKPLTKAAKKKSPSQLLKEAILQELPKVSDWPGLKELADQARVIPDKTTRQEIGKQLSKRRKELGLPLPDTPKKTPQESEQTQTELAQQMFEALSTIQTHQDFKLWWSEFSDACRMDQIGAENAQYLTNEYKKLHLEQTGNPAPSLDRKQNKKKEVAHV